MKYVAPAVITAAIAAGFAPSAFAALEAVASVSNLHLYLVDLDLGDGIEPSVTFNNDLSRSNSIVYTRVATGGAPFQYNYRDVRFDAPAALVPIVAADSALGAEAKAIVSGNGGLEGLAFGVTARASAYDSNSIEAAYATPGTSLFEVSPMTAVHLIADVDTHYVLTPEPTAPGSSWPSAQFGFAMSTLSLSLYASLPGPAFDSDIFGVELSEHGWDRDYFPGKTGPEDWPGQSQLTLIVSNSTRSSVIGGVGGRAMAGGYSHVVPEPSTYALLLGGLLALGFAVRRNRDGSR